jgi:DNA-binding transcriptional LysR family regulator
MANSIPPMNALRAFEAAARLGSVTAAAQEAAVLHMAPSVAT